MTLIASDTFTRANSTTSLGNADTGQPWSIAPLSPGGALWGIDSGKAYVPAPSMASFVDYSGVPKNIAVVGAGIGTHDVSADITLSATSPSVGVVAKYVDENNFVVAFMYNTTSYGIQIGVCYLGGFTFAPLATPTVTKGATYTLRVEVTATDSNTPQQALTLLNDPAFVEAARVFAARILKESGSSETSGRLSFAYRAALNREPKEQEATSLAAFLKEHLPVAAAG